MGERDSKASIESHTTALVYYKILKALLPCSLFFMMVSRDNSLLSRMNFLCFNKTSKAETRHKLYHKVTPTHVYLLLSQSPEMSNSVYLRTSHILSACWNVQNISVNTLVLLDNIILQSACFCS